MDGVVWRAYHVAELGKSLFPECLAGDSVCVHIVWWRILLRIMKAIKSVKMLNILHNLTLSKIML